MSAIGWLVRAMGRQKEEAGAREAFDEAIAKVKAERAEYDRNVRIMRRAAVTVERSLASVPPNDEEDVTPQAAGASP